MPPPMSPHRQLGDPLSPRPLRTHVPPRIDVDAKPNVVLGFSPPSSAGLPTLPEGSTPNPLAAAPLQFPPSSTQLSRLSPQLTTPTDQVGFGFNSSSPLQYGTSPRGHHAELPPRSRRNSAAIVSISLSSRSRSRTPRGVHSVLPAGSSGNATPDKGSNTVTPRAEDAAFMPGPIDFDPLGDLQPTGGLLLDDEGSDTHRDEAVIEDDVDDHGRQWTVDGYQEEDVVEDILSPGFEFGEGLEFEGEVIQPAVGRVAGINGSEGLPLRRGGSEAGKPSRGNAPNKVYQVIRRLGSGSYAVVYLVREKGGRRREYGECLGLDDRREIELTRHSAQMSEQTQPRTRADRDSAVRSHHPSLLAYSQEYRHAPSDHADEAMAVLDARVVSGRGSVSAASSSPSALANIHPGSFGWKSHATPLLLPSMPNSTTNLPIPCHRPSSHRPRFRSRHLKCSQICLRISRRRSQTHQTPCSHRAKHPPHRSFSHTPIIRHHTRDSRPPRPHRLQACSPPSLPILYYLHDDCALSHQCSVRCASLSLCVMMPVSVIGTSSLRTSSAATLSSWKPLLS